MEKYIIPRNERRHLVVSKDVHDAVSLYACQRELTLVEATYHLLKVAFIREYDLQVQDEEVHKYEIKRPSAFDFRRWFKRR